MEVTTSGNLVKVEREDGGETNVLPHLGEMPSSQDCHACLSLAFISLQVSLNHNPHKHTE